MLKPVLRIWFIFFRIWIRGSGFKNSDPILDLDMFLMFRIINIFIWHFPTKSKHAMTLKIKDKKNIWRKLDFRQFHDEKI